MTAHISENLIYLMDHVDSIKLYQCAVTNLYCAEVTALDGGYFYCQSMSLEDLLAEVVDTVRRN